uniref:Flagellar biosynthesis protein FlhB n=1 Tax=uncultured Planctomycetota bacterium TaxID=120965 RepID=H5SCQ7_9BACT|nr:flagellar biosynthesis protein FlhB [uncultured Planctomycetota bacterium]
MADEWFDSRTEQPTERRRQRAREEGHVAVSHELTAAVLLLAGVLALVVAGNHLGVSLIRRLGQAVEHCRQQEWSFERLIEVCQENGWSVLGSITSLLLMIALAGLATHLAQTGLLFVPGLVSWHVERISPATGWARLVSWSAVWRTGLACGKVILLMVVGWWALSGRGEQIASWSDIPLAVAVPEVWSLAMRLALYAGLCLLALGLADYAWQRWRYERQLMMTRWELKEELRQDEGDPHMRARLRKLMREMSQRRMLQDVAQATVVLRNPTHVAVALRYERTTMSAPQVVAKGAGALAERIIEIARHHGVPILERPPLAQALFRLVPVGQEIPPVLYLAVAEVLAFVYRQRGWSAHQT